MSTIQPAISFNSRPSCDGRLSCVNLNIPALQFQFTPVLRRATGRKDDDKERVSGFNSRPSCDGRPIGSIFKKSLDAFQFTPVLRRATARFDGILPSGGFQFTPVLRRATADGERFKVVPHVSIHARLATGDTACVFKGGVWTGFNSRPSCDGRRRTR